MKKIAPNSECWCGSGRKYKLCHLKQDNIVKKLVKKGYKAPPREIFKSKKDIEGIKKSGEITKYLLDNVEQFIKDGTKTIDIDKWIDATTREMGGIPAPLNYHGFPKSVCTSVNGCVCHGIPGEETLKNGDIINVDVTTILDGYFADASRMYFVGEVSENAKRLSDKTKEMLYAGIKAVKPYEPVNVIGDIIEKMAKENGYSVVRALTGHGVGFEFHEEPAIYHFKDKTKGMIMVPGMVFTIEPMINEGKFHVDTLSDDWTVVTRDGKLSAQWEHTIAVTKTGCEILT